MATLEALHAVLQDDGAPEIIKNYVLDCLHYAMRHHGERFSTQEVQWIARWDNPRLPIAANHELKRRAL